MIKGVDRLSEPRKLIDSARAAENAVKRLTATNIGNGIKNVAPYKRASISVPIIMMRNVVPNMAKDPLRDFRSRHGINVILPSILKSEYKEWVFCGFYRVVKENLLEIGPYQGDVLACGHIDFNRGVCGKSARTQTTVIVDDVSLFPGYISCDDQTVSEIVIPVIKDEQLIAVLDIDGDQVGQFDDTDQTYLEKMVRLI